MNKFEINIGIFGNVSVGKSTLLNAITGQQYSDTEIKKTTMVPQAYIGENTNDYNTDNIINANTIRNINRKNNEQISQLIDNNQFNIDKCQTIYHNIDKICDLFDPTIIDPNLKINIYDIPGLNDSASKDIYFEWVKQNVNMFDIIIFMTEISRGLNNSDEIEVLRLLLESIKKYNSKMICLINKCDDIYYDSEQNDLVFEDIEQQNIYIQANNILTDIAKSYNFEANDNNNNFTPFLPISAENCFIYRALIKNPLCELDPNHKNKLCKNECGLNQWKKMTNDEKENLFQQILKNIQQTYDNKILETGYLAVKEIIQNTIVNNKSQFIINHIENDIKQLDLPVIENITEYIKIISKYVSTIEQANIIIDNKSCYESFWKHVSSTINNYLFHILKINTKIVNYGEFINIEEFDSVHTMMQNHCMNFKILIDSINKIPGYPRATIQAFESRIHNKLLSIYECISNFKFIDQFHVCPANIKRYLEIIKTYAPERFYYFSVKFTKKFCDTSCNHITSNPDDFIDLMTYISKNNSENDNVFIIIICKILINKQNQIQTKSPEKYFMYLVQMKKLLKNYYRENNLHLESKISPIDIFYEVICKNISLFLGTSCVVSIYKQEICHNKIITLLDNFNDKQWDLDFEKKILNIFVKKI